MSDDRLSRSKYFTLDGQTVEALEFTADLLDRLRSIRGCGNGL